jgi:DNA uptake protein ComE-like DNA-binding protein
VPHPPRRRIPVGQVLLAALLPLLTVGLGAWIYFVVLGFRHNAKRQYIVAAAYAAIWIIGFFTTAAVDPTPPDSPDLSGAEVTGVTLLFLTAIASAFHGVVMATHMSLTSDHRKLALSEHARQVAAHDSALALQMGVGRPDLPRAFHGGLVDINHVEAAKLAKFTRLRRAEAHRVVADRIQRGPFLSPDDLVTRGLITRKRMQRIRPRLIAIPPVPQAGPAPWARPYS